ncbi:hypothetical protein ABB29_06345 [Pseudoxanthomonas dokdonensis]|uniref:3-carboxymuconate cyclase n=2 Tax=Pseudoxanthomonas dokdonensis TaxID=344882 RepID=A0A0R0CW14_9GAMM|nr:hypothetical protein ABB29_06345 [Pseudoxanthomonas dokdonensis]
MDSAEPASPTATSHLYTQTNETDNSIIHYGRMADGTLTEMDRVATGGKGTNGFKPATGEESAPDTLLSAYAVTMSRDHRWLFNVNAGDQSVSAFKVGADGHLSLTDTEATGEKAPPSSVAFDDKTQTLYVMHTLGPNHIRSFKLQDGNLVANEKSYTLNYDKFDNRVATSIVVSPDGRFLLADVLFNAPPAAGPDGPKLTPSNAGNPDGLVVFPITSDGSLGDPVLNDAGAPTPFSLAFLRGSNTQFVNTFAAGNGAVLSTLAADGTVSNGPLATVDLSLAPNGPSESCWVSISPDNSHAFVTNFGLGNLTSFSISGDTLTSANGSLGLVEGDGKFMAFAGIPTSGPNDSWASEDGFLYQLYPNASTLIAYRIEGKDLAEVGRYPIPYNSPSGLAGF